jgi:amino acid transporter
MSNSFKEEVGVENIKFAGSFDLCLLGITIVIGGQYFGWNIGLSMGLIPYSIAYALISCGYLCLLLCLSELSSCVPFGKNYIYLPFKSNI